MTKLKLMTTCLVQFRTKLIKSTEIVTINITSNKELRKNSREAECHVFLGCLKRNLER